MQDITERFLAAKAHGSWPVESLVDAHRASSAFPGLRLEWDSTADERWIRLLKTSMMLALVWVPGPLVIETSGHQELAPEVERVTGISPEVVVVPHMDSPMLCVAPVAVWPDREWPTGAIDPGACSAHDLWYATS
jgi:hypothetical protein